jgi:hypothetical protein
MAAGDGLRAAVCAGRLCMEHFFRSEASLAAGWLMRAQRLLRDQPEGVYHGYLALAESTLARARGAGYHLARLGRSFVILEADRRIGDVWRQRWDSLRLFTPARHDGLPGWTFPAKGWSFPSRDDMADYLEAYAARFGLPIRTGMPVDGVTGDRDGAVLVVGAGNSGAEIALESAGAQQVWLSGREVGAIPFRMGGLPSRLLLERLALRVLLHRVLTVRTPMGRKMRARMGAGERR